MPTGSMEPPVYMTTPTELNGNFIQEIQANELQRMEMLIFSIILRFKKQHLVLTYCSRAQSREIVSTYRRQ